MMLTRKQVRKTQKEKETQKEATIIGLQFCPSLSEMPFPGCVSASRERTWVQEKE